MRRELEALLELAKRLPPEELPAFLGELEQIRVTALARITAQRIDASPDALLDVTQAAARLNCSPDYLYRHHKRLPFARRVGRALRFSASGLDAFLKRAHH